MVLKYIIKVIFVIIFAGFSGCNSNKIPTEGNVKAHVIDYKVQYLNSKAGSIPTSILPGIMTVAFADHYALNRIDGFLGQFSLRFIANLKTRKVTTLVKIFDKKFVYYGNAGELPVCMAPLDSLNINEESETIEFAGFKCKKLLVSSSNYNDFNIFCTDQIDVKNPNNTTPFKAVNEVLLMFNTRLSLLEMQMKAIKYEEKEVPWEIFRVPEDYVKISRLDMEQLINELFK